MEYPRSMTDFAVIIHPVNLDLLYAFDPGVKRLKSSIVKKVLEWTPSFCASPIQGTRSVTGKEVEGYLIMCPLLPEQLLDLNHGQDLVMKRLLEAARIAEELGARILGLSAYTSIVGRKGMLLAKEVRIPVTTGSSYTVGVVLEGIFMACEEIGIQLRSSKVVVVGATGTIGSACSSILGGKVELLKLVGRNMERLEDLVAKLKQQEGVKGTIQFLDSVQEASKDADVIIICTNSPSAFLDVSCLKPGAIVCNVSQPQNVDPEASNRRQDVLFIDGGIVKPPGQVNFNFNFGLPPGLAFACIAETMILALEERYESYSLGGSISLQKIQDIVAFGKRHGFKFAGLRSLNTDVEEERIEMVREARMMCA